MKRLLMIWCISLSFGLRAQTYSKADSVKIYALLDAADEADEMGDAMKLAREALELSLKTKMLRGEGWANLKIAYLQIENTENADVRHYWDTGIAIGKKLQDNFMLGIAEIQQGKYSMYNNDLAKAEDFFKKALNTYFEKEQSKYTAILYNDIGMLCGKKNEREQEVTWYLKAMKLHESLGDLHGWANTSGNLANTFYRMGNKADALKYAKEALKIHKKNNNAAGLATVSGNLSTMYSTYNDLDSAIVYRQAAMKYAMMNGQKKHMIQSYLNLALLYERQQKFPEAMTAIRESIALSHENNDLPGAASKSRVAAEIAAKSGELVLMESFYKKGMHLADSLKRKDILRDLYLSRSQRYEKTGDYQKAFDNGARYHFLKDSLETAQVKNSIAELQVKYETERKDFEISKLNTEQKIRQLEIEKQKAVIAGNELLARKKESEIRELNDRQKLRESVFLQQKSMFEKQILVTRNKEQELKLARQQLLLTRQDKEIRDRLLQRQRLLQWIAAGAVVLAGIIVWILFNRYQLRKKLEEKEVLLAIRTNISKDLHDEIGSSLTNINILNELAKRNLSDVNQAEGYLKQSSENIQMISESLGDIVWNLNLRQDTIDNLLIRMKRYASDMLEGANIDYELAFPEDYQDLKLSMGKRRDFYLFFKEAVNNLVKYAKAGHAVIKVVLNEGLLELQVLDDGVGFNPQTISKGNGLNNMYHRADLLNGSVSIHSKPDHGTSIYLKVPL